MVILIQSPTLFFFFCFTGEVFLILKYDANHEYAKIFILFFFCDSVKNLSFSFSQSASLFFIRWSTLNEIVLHYLLFL